MQWKNVCLIVMLLMSAVASHAEEKIVEIATLEDYAPFCMAGVNVQGNQIIPVGKDARDFRGYSWDVVRESFHEMGYTIHLSVVPWARAMYYVKTGSVDILFPAGGNAERQKIFSYAEEPVNQANFVVYVRADDPFEWKGLESLQGLRIGVKREFNYGDKWKAAAYIQKHDVRTILQGFRMLKEKRLDGFVGYEASWDYVLKQHQWDSLYRKLPAFDSSGEYLVALKRNSKAREFLNAFDAGKKRLIEQGKLEAITQKWFGKSPSPTPRKGRFFSPGGTVRP